MKHHGSFVSVIYYLLDCLGSCVACCLPFQVEGSKGSHSQLGLDNSDESWSSSAYGLDSFLVHSSRNSSFIDTRDHRSKQSNCNGIIDHPNFVNHGFILWNQNRHQWVGNKESQEQGNTKQPMYSWTKSYGTFAGMTKPLQKKTHVPLSEMVDCLVDVWDQDGLYD